MRKAHAVIPLGLLLAVCSLSGGVSAQTRATASIRLIDTLSTGSSQPGDTFTATLATPLVVGDRVVAEKGARCIGQVREVVSSGRLSRPALITLSLKTVQAPSGRYPMQTGDLTVKAGSHATRNLLIIGGTAGVGAAIGSATGGGKGAAIGAAAGTGAGTAGAYLTGKREIVLPAETLLTFHVTSVTISPKELARLQRVGPGTNGTQGPIERQIIVQRRHHDDDEDDDDDDEHEGYHSHYPRHVDVVFVRDHHASVVIYWPRRIERLTLRGDDLEDILEPLSEHTHVKIEVLRPRIKIKHDD